VKALLHVHSRFSYDGENTLEDLSAWGRGRGLDAILLSEHVNGFDEAKMRALVDGCEALRGRGAELVPGLEFAVRGGFHLLGYGIAHYRALTDPAEAVRFIRDQGGLAVLAHPGRYRGRWPADDVVDALDGVEAWNARYDGRFMPSGALLGESARWRRNGSGPRLYGGQDLHAVAAHRLVVTEAAGARTAAELVNRLRSGTAEFGNGTFRVAMDPPVRSGLFALSLLAHPLYRWARSIRDRITPSGEASQ